MTRHQLSRNFVVEEFDCKDGTKVPPRYHKALQLLCETYLEPLREKYGICRVHSGFRTTLYNKAVGGASASFHVYTDRSPIEGVAVDVSFARGSVSRWHRSARWLRWRKRKGAGGIGYYPRGGFIHLDTRTYNADWEGP